MITIVVMAYSRPASLRRLLHSVEHLHRGADAQLIVALDPGATDQHDVERVIADVQWPADRFEVLRAPEPLGLVGNFLRCGALAEERGDLVLLEDDLELAVTALDWVRCALDQYRNDPLVAGVSLNSLWFNGFSHRRFEPMPDGSDAFLLRLPWYQGMVVTAQWWQLWMSDDSAADMHPVFDRFGTDEWYPAVARAVVASGRFFVYPRVSHAVNHGEPGVHFDQRTSWFQTPLERRWRSPHLVPAAESLARYDQFMEYDPVVLSAEVADVPSDVIIDLTGQRPLPGSGPVLTIRSTASFERRWGTARRPLEANVIHDEPGDGIRLVDASSVDAGWRARLLDERRLDLHDNHGRRPGLRNELLARVLELGRRRWR